MSGNAADIAITDGHSRFKFINIALAQGIKRIGLHPHFIHLDIANDRPLENIWFYPM
jgi:hypothetical protein